VRSGFAATDNESTMRIDRVTCLNDSEWRLRLWNQRVERLLERVGRQDSRPQEVVSLLHKKNSLANKIERLRQVPERDWDSAFAAVHRAGREVEDAWITACSRIEERERDNNVAGGAGSGLFFALTVLLLAFLL